MKTIIMSVIGALLLLIRDGKFLWKKKDEPKKPKQNLGTGAMLVLMFGVISCGGALEQFADAHKGDIIELEACGIQCGVDLAVEALSCPVNGGSIEDVINAKGLTKDAAKCVLNCMTVKAADVFSEVCKDAAGG